MACRLIKRFPSYTSCVFAFGLGKHYFLAFASQVSNRTIKVVREGVVRLYQWYRLHPKRPVTKQYNAFHTGIYKHMDVEILFQGMKEQNRAIK